MHLESSQTSFVMEIDEPLIKKQKTWEMKDKLVKNQEQIPIESEPIFFVEYISSNFIEDLEG